MSILWMDNFSSYGTGTVAGTGNMVNGLYSLIQVPSIVADPDPTVAAGKYVLECDTFAAVTRVVGVPQTTLGVAFRFWPTSLPSGNRTIFSYIDQFGAVQGCLVLTSSGGLYYFRGDQDDVALGGTAGPVVVPNAWQHIETKVVFSQTVGTVEVRVEGIVVLTLTGQDTCQSAQVNASQVQLGVGDTGSIGRRFKDFIVWNGSGSHNNDFLGSCQVVSLRTNADVTMGGWTSTTGGAGNQILATNRPWNRIAFTAQPAVALSIQANATYYRFTAGSVNAGTPAGTSGNPWLVALGASTLLSLGNLQKAINATGVAGTDYSTALVANTTIEAVGISATTLTVWGRDGITAYTGFASAATNTAWFSTATVNDGRPNDFAYISADDTPPAECQFEMTDLPVDVTSVKGLMILSRVRKADGGDAQIQPALVSNGADALGSDRPVTTAFTYYWDVIEEDPDTAALWLPPAVDAVILQYDRTV